jgi:hypothetical protein
VAIGRTRANSAIGSSRDEQRRVGDPVLVARRAVAAAFLVDPVHEPARERADRGAEEKGDRDEAVGRREEEAKGQAAVLQAAGGSAHLRRAERVAEDVGLGRERDRLLRRHVDVLAEARALALVVRDQRRDGGLSGRVQIGLRNGKRTARGRRRLAARAAGGEQHEVGFGGPRLGPFWPNGEIDTARRAVHRGERHGRAPTPRACPVAD